MENRSAAWSRKSKSESGTCTEPTTRPVRWSIVDGGRSRSRPRRRPELVDDLVEQLEELLADSVGVGRSTRLRICPSRSITPAAIFVPPTSIPMARSVTRLRYAAEWRKERSPTASTEEVASRGVCRPSANPSAHRRERAAAAPVQGAWAEAARTEARAELGSLDRDRRAGSSSSCSCGASPATSPFGAAQRPRTSGFPHRRRRRSFRRAG
jgi:hypothetical protein